MKTELKSAPHTNARFVASVIATAAGDKTVMPWTRGARRAAFIAKRNAAPASRAA